MRVVYILNTNGLGGANRSLLEFIHYLVNKGVECFAILPESGGIEEEFQKIGIEYLVANYRTCVRYPGYIGMPYLVNAIMIPQITYKIKKWKVDLIHTNSSTHDIGMIISRILNIKHIWHVREVLEQHFHAEFFHPRLYAYLRGKSDVVICVSNFVYDYNQKNFPNSNMKMLYNPFDLNYYDIVRIGFAERNEINILMAGNITKSKGQLDGVKALVELRQRNVCGIRIILVGNAEKEAFEEIETYIKKEKLESDVQYLGMVSDLREIRAKCDISLNCSLAEALPRVTIEGMLSEMLSIGADSGGTAEVIENEVTGLLYEPGNYVQLADKIEYAINHKKECRQMVIKAKKYAIENFNQKENAEKLLEIYWETLRK